MASGSDDSHVVNDAFPIIEEGEVTCLALFGKIDWTAYLNLVCGIAHQVDTAHFIDHLNQSGGIDSEGGSTAPEIRSMQVAFCQFDDPVTSEGCFCGGDNGSRELIGLAPESASKSIVGGKYGA